MIIVQRYEPWNQEEHDHNLSLKPTKVDSSKAFNKVFIVLEQISTIQANLQNSIEFRELTITEINKYKNKPLVMEYWKEYKKQLNEVIDESGERLYIELVYDAHAFFIFFIGFQNYFLLRI